MAPFVHNCICVFCASSTQVSETYQEAARHLAKILVENKIGVRYGGGEVGLMGVIANYFLKHNGKITGVIPKFMVDVEWQHKDVEDMILVETMHQRKNLLIQDVDAVVALPGSTGTLEELIEVISLKKLGLFSKPIIVINTNGFYDPLIAQFTLMIDQSFMRPEHAGVCTFINDPTNIVDIIQNTPLWYDDDKKLAAL